MMSDDGGSSTALNFSNRFGEEAYRVLENRFPDLMQYVRTFKIVDIDHESGFGVGAFVLWAGDNSIHIPVVMYDGDISSCEMVYDKSSKLLSPLVNREVERIESANQNKANILARRPMIENTTPVFTNMYRPPRSTNVILASSRVDIAELPASAKQQLVEILNAHPDILAKVAEFYPLEQLTSKLAYRKTPDAAPTKATESSVLRVNDILDNATDITPAQRSALLSDGYCIKQGSFTGDLVPADQLFENAQKQLDATVLTAGWAESGTGYLLTTRGLSLVKRKCVVHKNTLFTDRGIIELYPDERNLCCPDNSNNRVVVDYNEGITARDLEAMGWVLAKELALPMDDGVKVCFMIPKRGGGYVALQSSDYEVRTMWLRGKNVRRVNNDVIFYDGSRFVQVSPLIDSGYMKLEDGSFVVPHGTYAKTFTTSRSTSEASFLTLSGFDRIIKSLGQKITLKQDGPSYTLDTPNGSFTQHTEADIAKTANEQLGLSQADFKALRQAKSVYLFSAGIEKTAFVDVSPVETKEYINSESALPQQRIPDVDRPNLLSAASDLRDKELFDLSMLASVSSNPDVRATVLDSLTTFMEANSEIGTILLNMAVHEDEFDKFYGSEQFVKLRSSLRRLFKQFGDIINQLREFIVME